MRLCLLSAIDGELNTSNTLNELCCAGELDSMSEKKISQKSASTISYIVKYIFKRNFYDSLLNLFLPDVLEVHEHIESTLS